MHFNMKSNERLLWNYLLLRYFKGRNCCGKKLLRRKSTNFRNFFFRNNVIFHNSQLFLPQQYNLSQFASFFPAIYTLRILIDVPQLTNFFTCFALPSPTLYSNTPPPPLHPHPVLIIFTLTGIHARYYQILLTFLTLIVVWVIFLPIDAMVDFELDFHCHLINSKMWLNKTLWLITYVITV